MVRAATIVPIISPVCCFLGVAPRRNPVLRSCDVSPAIAATIQIIEPMEIAEIIPSMSDFPVTFRMSDVIRSVAIAMPETGLLLLPTRPTIRDDTVAKKKPNTTIISAPSKETGIAGINQIASVSTIILPITKRISISLSVRRVFEPEPPLMPRIASRNVLTISGKVLTKLIIPPAATAPAPM